MPTIKQRPTIMATLDELALYLRSNLDAVARHQESALDYAIAAGEVITQIKQHLQDNPVVLQSFGQWFKANIKDHSLRSANTYQIVYTHVIENSNTFYASIKDVLIDYRKTHPKRERYIPPTEEEIRDKARKELLAAQENPELLPFEKPTMGGMHEILADNRIKNLLNDPDVKTLIWSSDKLKTLIDLLLQQHGCNIEDELEE